MNQPLRKIHVLEQPPKPAIPTKRFHLGDILSVVPGYLVSPRHIDGVYDILNWMTGDSLFTHQLPRAARECEPHLLKQFPFLSEVDATTVKENNWKEWLDVQVKKYREHFDVAPIPKEAHQYIDPVLEMCDMVGPEKVIVLDARPPLDK